MEKNYRHINKDIHYFCLMHPIQSFFGISFTTSSDEPEWFECEVVEDRYKVDDNYKITLRDINGQAHETYYQDDFLSHMYYGLIIPKTNDDMHIETVSFDEPIPNSIAYIHHEGQCVVGTVDPIKVGDTVRIRSFSFSTNVTSIDENKNTAVVEWIYDGKLHSEICEINELMRIV